MTQSEMDRLKDLWNRVEMAEGDEFDEMLDLRDKLVTLILG